MFYLPEYKPRFHDRPIQRLYLSTVYDGLSGKKRNIGGIKPDDISFNRRVLSIVSLLGSCQNNQNFGHIAITIQNQEILWLNGRPEFPGVVSEDCALLQSLIKVGFSVRDQRLNEVM